MSEPQPETHELSDEEAQFLKELDKQLKDRYTEKDDEFAVVFSQDKVTPPVLKVQEERRFNNRSNPRQNQQHNAWRNNNSNNRSNSNGNGYQNERYNNNSQRYNNTQRGGNHNNFSQDRNSQRYNPY